MTDIFNPIDVDQNIEDDNPLETLVGEGKKFATPEDLAKGKIESDRFIERLQNELAELRQEVSKGMTMNELLTQIRESAGSNRNEGQQQQPAPAEPENEYSPEKIEELVRSQMTALEKQRMTQKNQETVAQRLSERFGSDAQVHINKKAKELGVTTDYLKNVAGENPGVFFRLIQLDSTPTGGTPPAPRSSVSAPSSSGERNKAYYDQLKAKDRNAYFSREVQMEMYKDMEKVLKAGGTWA